MGNLMDPHDNGVTMYHMLRDNYDSQGADQQVAFEDAIRRVDSLSFDAFPSAQLYNAEYNAAKQALAAMGKPLDNASCKMYYLHGLGRERNKTVDLRSSERCSSPLALSVRLKTFLSLPAFRSEP